jgi:hypothetical protein
LAILSACSGSTALLLAAELEAPPETDAPEVDAPEAERGFPAAELAAPEAGGVGLLSPAAATLFDAIAMAARAIRGMARGAVSACQRVFISTMIGVFLSIVI